MAALLCHAAVMARELGISAVIGCQRAMELIGDGDLVDVDPGAGEVRIVERATSPEQQGGRAPLRSGGRELGR